MDTSKIPASIGTCYQITTITGNPARIVTFTSAIQTAWRYGMPVFVRVSGTNDRRRAGKHEHGHNGDR